MRCYEAMSKPARKPQLPPLTGLRYLAALLVVAFHVRPLHQPENHPLQRLVGRGYVGVGLFFVLSGFILAYTYLDGSPSPTIDRRAFWRARFARIYPVYVIGLVLALPFFLREVIRAGSPLVAPALLAPALLQSWVPSAACSWNCPGWSLSAEAFFYLLFPVLATWAAARRDRHLAFLMFGAWAIALVAPMLYLRLNPDGIGAGTVYDHAFWLFVVKFDPAVQLPQFLLGVLAGQWYLRGRGRSLSRLALPAFAAVLLVLALPLDIPYVMLDTGILTPLFALLILALASGDGLLHRLLRHPLMVRLGEASYALYILHVPLVAASASIAKRIGVDATSLAFRVACAIGATVAALVVYRWIEEPMRKRLRGRPIAAPAALLHSVDVGAAVPVQEAVG